MKMGFDILLVERQIWRLGLCGLDGSYSSAAIMAAIAGVSEARQFGFGGDCIVAVVNRLPNAAGMRRGSQGQGQRAEVAHKRYQQQHSGDQSLHGFSTKTENLEDQNRAQS